MENLHHNQGVLELIRSSSIKNEEKSPTDWSKNGGKNKHQFWKPAVNKAVEHVKRERIKEGLPEDVRREMKDIEEKLVRADLKGADINSELDSYLDTQTFTRKIVNANWADRVAKMLVEWVNKPCGMDEDGNFKYPIKVTEFFREKGIYHRDFHTLKNKFPVLKQALDYAEMVLGDIRERNMLEGKWNVTVGMFTMGQYDPKWREEQDRRESAKLKQAEATGVNVNALMAEMITPVPQTEEVRVKMEQDKKRIKDGADRERKEGKEG